MEHYLLLLSPNIARHQYERKVDEIINEARKCRHGVVIADDINAKASEWMETLNIKTHNNGKTTFERRGGTSYIDVTCSTKEISRKIKNWTVLNQDTLTEHKYIYYELAGEKVKWEERKIIQGDWKTFRTHINQATEEGGTNTNHVDVTEKIKEAYDMIGKSREESNRLRGTATRMAACHNTSEEEKMQEIRTGLFPKTPERMEIRENMEDVEPFTVGELMLASKQMKKEKAPGHNGIPPEAIKEISKIKPQWLLNMLNELLIQQKFPDD
ncbi:hypothetical protein JTB14_001040 [Gonioctena quinquepunctata]|nr:hypothetical protein JTB14_001040 [Gonioctena quinquepunctata]